MILVSGAVSQGGVLGQVAISLAVILTAFVAIQLGIAVAIQVAEARLKISERSVQRRQMKRREMLGAAQHAQEFALAAAAASVAVAAPLSRGLAKKDTLAQVQETVEWEGDGG
jgi:hypothetical protein